MARKSHARRLGVWMNGEAVGYWELTANGTSEFGYVQSWLTSPQRRPISLSLPLRPASQPYFGPQVDRFFDNLLPDTKKIENGSGAGSVLRPRVHSTFSRTWGETASVPCNCCLTESNNQRTVYRGFAAHGCRHRAIAG